MNLLTRVLNRLTPAPAPTVNWLAVAEAARDTWEKGELNNLDCPVCFPDGWEDLVHDSVCTDDTPDPAPRPASSRRGGAEPAGTGPLSPVPAGAPHPALALTRALRDLGVAIPTAVAVELTQFFNLTKKK